MRQVRPTLCDWIDSVGVSPFLVVVDPLFTSEDGTTSLISVSFRAPGLPQPFRDLYLDYPCVSSLVSTRTPTPGCARYHCPVGPSTQVVLLLDVRCVQLKFLDVLQVTPDVSFCIAVDDYSSS